jgi:leucyl aminopeptidase (aminopeptidase T)
MNERMKELWEEAAKTTQSDSWEEQTKFMERFAELIVRECVSIADEYDGVGSTIVSRIRKHFGVEE